MQLRVIVMSRKTIFLPQSKEDVFEAELAQDKKKETLMHKMVSLKRQFYAAIETVLFDQGCEMRSQASKFNQDYFGKSTLSTEQVDYAIVC